MVWINLADCCMNTVVEIHESGVLWIARLIKDIIAGDPSVILVMLGQLFPKPDHSVLKVAMIPKSSIVGRIV